MGDYGSRVGDSVARHLSPHGDIGGRNVRSVQVSAVS
jgi:hypothetical protein